VGKDPLRGHGYIRARRYCVVVGVFFFDRIRTHRCHFCRSSVPWTRQHNTITAFVQQHQAMWQITSFLLLTLVLATSLLSSSPVNDELRHDRQRRLSVPVSLLESLGQPIFATLFLGCVFSDQFSFSEERREFCSAR